ncbi:hypothetical protein BGZ68_001292 [Mortierella alpina]|nr:hypothetical protein BGZ68_001292 [Mortierella alpina]
MDPSQEPLLTVNDLFCKARPPPARPPAPHRSHAATAASPSSSPSASAPCSSQPLARAHSQARVVTFVGQIVHVLTNTHPDQKTIIVPQDPLRYPLQRHALRLYQKKGHDLPLDLIVWLAPLGSQEHSAREASRIKSIPEASKTAARDDIQDSSTTDTLVKKEDDASTALSWSDSDQSQCSQTDSGSSDDEALVEQVFPDAMVAVLLSRAFDRDKGKDKDKDKDTRRSSLQRRFRTGDIVTVHKAVMLFDENNGKKVVSCVGIPDRTTFTISPRPHRNSKSSKSRTSRRDSPPTSRATRTSTSGSEKRKASVESSADGRQEEDGGPSSSAKRRRTGTGKLDGNHDKDKDKDEVTTSTGRVNSNPIKHEMATSFEKEFSVRKPRMPASSLGKGLSVRQPLVPASSFGKGLAAQKPLVPATSFGKGFSLAPATAQAPNSLQLLVRKSQERTLSCTSDGREEITYFSTLFSNVSCRSVNSGSSHTTPDHSSRSSSTSSDHNTSRSSSSSGGGVSVSSNMAEQAAATRHICWLRDIRCATLRAVCAECGNIYRNLSCVFGCRSRTWRLGIRMECIVNDGTGQARLIVTDDQENVMWTLLDLSIKTGSIGCDSPDTHATPRNTVLAIVARRGELSYRTDAPDSPALSSPSLASSSGHVETIDDDRSERAQTEERLWLNICRRCPSVERTLLLDAVANRSSRGPVSSDTLADRPGKLKTSLVRLGAETTILTLVPPPLVLCAVDVKRIQPKTEARMLLSQLGG